MRKHLLIADDDADLAKLIGLSVAVLWPDCTLDIVSDGAAALRQAAERTPDVAILDVMMPPPDGLAVCHHLRKEFPRLPILLLTARDTTLDEVRGLDSGADDYLMKPFDHLRLIAHLRALLRRTEMVAPAHRSQGGNAVTVGDLCIDFDAHTVYRGGETLDLTPTEYLLLEMLARHAGEIVSHQTLLERVCGREYIRNTHYLKVFINRLRHKIRDDAAHPRYIETRRNVGYRLATIGTG